MLALADMIQTALMLKYNVQQARCGRVTCSLWGDIEHGPAGAEREPSGKREGRGGEGRQCDGEGSKWVGKRGVVGGMRMLPTTKCTKFWQNLCVQALVTGEKFRSKFVCL